MDNPEMSFSKVEELKSKTKVYEGGLPELGCLKWARYDRIELKTLELDVGDPGVQYGLLGDQAGLERDYSDGFEYYVVDAAKAGSASMDASLLPTEFFNHQLFDEYKKSEDRIGAFMEEWGLLLSPLRNDWACLDGWQFIEAESMQGVRETDYLNETMPELTGVAVSKLEAETTMMALRETVLLLRKHIRSGGDDRRSLYLLSGPLRAASCHPLQIRRPWIPSETDLAREEMMERLEAEISEMAEEDQAAALKALEGSNRQAAHGALSGCSPLVSAICNQIIETISTVGVPWRECACGDCSVLFKYAQSQAMTPNLDSYYCCPAHSARERKRRQRSTV